jgi:hypothetical protein
MGPLLKDFPPSLLVAIIILMGGALSLVGGMLYIAVRMITNGFKEAIDKMDKRLLEREHDSDLIWKDLANVRLERETVRRQHPTFEELRERLKPMNLRLTYLETASNPNAPRRRLDDPDSGPNQGVK